MTSNTSVPSVLLVDDHPDVLLLWRLVLLTDGGFGTIEEARDGRAALEHLETSCPDVVVTDYAMPGLSGLAVADAARRKRSDAIIVVSSNSCDVGDEALHCGASAFMNKYRSTTDRLPELLHRLLAEVRSGQTWRSPCRIVGGSRQASEQSAADISAKRLLLSYDI